MIYTYPKPQSIYRNTLFLIKETVDSNKFTEYHIPFEEGNVIHIKIITDDVLKKLIELGVVLLDEKVGFFNGKPFYRIPLSTQQALI